MGALTRQIGIPSVTIGRAYPDPEPVDSGFPTVERAIAILPGDPLLGVWEDKLMRHTVGLLKPVDSCTSVNVVRMGKGESWQQYPVCILISSRDKVDNPELGQTILTTFLRLLGPEWSSAAAFPTSELDRAGDWALMTLRVKFIQAQVSRYRSLKSGDTISCAGANGKVKSGIIGGFLKVSVNGEVNVYGLTCHHVAADGKTAVVETDGEIPSTSHHVSSSSRSAEIIVHSPSNTAH